MNILITQLTLVTIQILRLPQEGALRKNSNSEFTEKKKKKKTVEMNGVLHRLE